MDTETFDSLRARLGARYDQLTPHLQRVGRLALEDPNVFALETVAAIAARARVQPSTIVRFAKEFGYSGFSQMQRVFKLRLIEGQPLYRERVYAREHTGPRPLGTEPQAILKEFVDASIGSLKELSSAIRGADMDRAVELLASA